jgi:hypothetical protein
VTHTPHDDLRDRLRSGLQGSGIGVLVDGCERCEQQAADPMATLDRDHIASLWREMVRVERDPEGVFRNEGRLVAYRSRADAKACRELYRIAVFLERFTLVDPWALFGPVPA